MDLFRSAGAGRQTNDANNKVREELLLNLYHTEDPAVQSLRELWKRMLHTLCSEPYEDVVLKKKGGRSANYDFEITFLRGGLVVFDVKAEFKHNANKICKLPEYFSPAADKPYTTRLYADFFYDYLDRVCEVYPGLMEHKPERDTYVSLVHTNDYNKHPFFRNLYDREKSGTAEQANQKQSIVRESIKEYLANYASTLNLAQLTQDIRERQTGKVFILWNLSDFVVDSIRDDEMEITHIESVKNNNTIVVVSKAGTRHNLLLRWKNHLGVLYPAWQISLTR